MTKKIKSIIELQVNACRWPVGDLRHADFHFCGAHQVPGRPYCTDHCTMSSDTSRMRQPSSAQSGVPAAAIRRAA
jgi:GcrA cell cycle regulator